MRATLEDLKMELWLRRRNNNEITWKTKKGETIPINQMTVSHLINTIEMIGRNKHLQEIACDFYAEDFGDR